MHERKQAQNALRTAYNDVERQVAERTEALNSSLEREQNLAAQLEKSLAKETQLQQMKTSIINNISHEFRTPLHIISMSADLLTEYRNKLSTTQSARYQGVGRLHTRPIKHVIPRSPEESRSYLATGTGFLLADSSK
ncbi:MAG: hypothetical protein H6668_03565 [Ardenticatenaceae bacterium]|nr:hypothetical protein [Ardenticatenaceae bacterium]